MLIVGAMAVIRHAGWHGIKRAWLLQLLAKRATKVAAVAPADKTARMVWTLMASGERYKEPALDQRSNTLPLQPAERWSTRNHLPT